MMKQPIDPMKKVGVWSADSPYSEQECEEIIAKLEQLLDGELDTEKENEVRQMVEGCGYCLEQFKVEKKFRTFIKNGFGNVSFSSGLIDSIRKRIHNFRCGCNEPTSLDSH